MELKFILESILFSAQHPLSSKELREVLAGAAEQTEDSAVKALKKTSLDAINTALEELASDHARGGRSYRLVCVAGSWQFASEPGFAPWIKALVGHRNRPGRLSQPALETLAIVAYRQPITRAEIEQVRGVAVDGVMQTLMERGLIEQIGRAEVIGRPITYGTTSGFLAYFGMKNLDELPAADELRRVVVQKPEALLTVDPGLATAPPEQLSVPSQAGSTGPTPPLGQTESVSNSSSDPNSSRRFIEAQSGSKP
jgi:segregation and condensation protein B